MSTWRCGASWAASSTTRAPYRWATAASSRTGHSSPVTLDAPVSTTSRGPAGAAASAVSRATTASPDDAGVRNRRTHGPFHGSSAAWCSVSNNTTEVAFGSERASRFSESVVLRVKTTVSRERAPTKDRSTSRAFSYTLVETWEAKPAPRWTLAYQGSSSSTASRTLLRQGALAAWSRLAYWTWPPVASGTVSVEPTTAGTVTAGRRVGRASVTSSSGSWDPFWRRVRACPATVCGGPGPHPGHPTAVGGLPASKPGLDAGTHDLTTGSPMAASGGKLGAAYVTACESAGPPDPGRTPPVLHLGLPKSRGASQNAKMKPCASIMSLMLLNRTAWPPPPSGFRRSWALRPSRGACTPASAPATRSSR